MPPADPPADPDAETKAKAKAALERRNLPRLDERYKSAWGELIQRLAIRQQIVIAYIATLGVLLGATETIYHHYKPETAAGGAAGHLKREVERDRALTFLRTKGIELDDLAAIKLHAPYIRVAGVVLGVVFLLGFMHHDLHIGQLEAYLAELEKRGWEDKGVDGNSPPDEGVHDWFRRGFDLHRVGHIDRHRLFQRLALVTVTLASWLPLCHLVYVRFHLDGNAEIRRCIDTYMYPAPLDTFTDRVAMGVGVTSIFCSLGLLMRMKVVRAAIRNHEFDARWPATERDAIEMFGGLLPYAAVGIAAALWLVNCKDRLFLPPSDQVAKVVVLQADPRDGEPPPPAPTPRWWVPGLYPDVVSWVVLGAGVAVIVGLGWYDHLPDTVSGEGRHTSQPGPWWLTHYVHASERVRVDAVALSALLAGFAWATWGESKFEHLGPLVLITQLGVYLFLRDAWPLFASLLLAVRQSPPVTGRP